MENDGEDSWCNWMNQSNLLRKWLGAFKSHWTDVSEQSRLFTDLVEMTRAEIRREPLLASSEREIPTVFPLALMHRIAETKMRPLYR